MSKRSVAIKQYTDLSSNLQKMMKNYDEEIIKVAPKLKEFLQYNRDVIKPQIKKIAEILPIESDIFKQNQANLLKLAQSVSELKLSTAGIMNALDSDVGKQLGGTREKIKKGFLSIIDEAEKTEEVLIDSSDSRDASSRVSEYYDAVIEAQEVSGLMSSVAEDIVSIQSKNTKPLQEKIFAVFSIIEDKIKKIIDTIKGSFKSLMEKVKDALNEFKKNVKEGAKKITSVFKDFAQKLSDLTVKVIEKIFGFVSWINTIANKKGFGISEISLKLPTAKVEVKNLLVIAVPVVTIETPEITFTFKPNTSIPPGKSSKESK